MSWLRAEPAEIAFHFGKELSTKLSWVSENGPAEVRFGDEVIAKGSKGEKSLSGLVSGRTYGFLLVDADETILASETVVCRGPTVEEWAAALSDPQAYESALEQERAHWGSEAAEKVARPEDIAERPEVVLRIGRDKLKLHKLIAQSGHKIRRALSLGCGGGRAERYYFGSGIRAEWDAMDISPQAIEAAREAAEAEGYEINYQVADLNFVELEPNAYDLIVAQTVLHHVLQLEHVLDQVERALRPDGLFWVGDFVGESQHQWNDLRLEIANAILDHLPERYRWNPNTKRLVERIERRPPGRLASPFESIRSGEIVPLLLERFETVAYFGHDAILKLVCPPGMRSAYAETEEGRERFEDLFALDRLLIKTGVLAPCGVQYLLTRRSGTSAPEAEAEGLKHSRDLDRP